MKGIWTLYIDQHGQKFAALTLAALRLQIANGKSRVSKMYVGKKDGSTVHCGYVIGHHWLTAYRPIEIPA